MLDDLSELHAVLELGRREVARAVGLDIIQGIDIADVVCVGIVLFEPAVEARHLLGLGLRDVTSGIGLVAILTPAECSHEEGCTEGELDLM